jgi:hypothetical protein
MITELYVRVSEDPIAVYLYLEPVRVMLFEKMGGHVIVDHYF